MTHEDLWRITWGELDDRIYAWRYAEYLETRKRAQLASWILAGAGNLRRPVGVEELAGIWHNGEIFAPRELRRKLEGEYRRRRGVVDHGKQDN